ncbi:hypothetical protein SDC9_95907 [bioreactor metagenome]|uniref:Uncharacterized protein n=1 Tax=bioreactor metagenome TaxID=1076179 RepID=A0A645A7L9_9ZZZZ
MHKYKLLPWGFTTAKAGSDILRLVLNDTGDKLSNLLFFYGMEIFQDNHKVLSQFFNAVDKCIGDDRYKVAFFLKGQVFRNRKVIIGKSMPECFA